MATAAPPWFPYLDRAMDEVFREERDLHQRIADLDWVSRRRELTERESRRLEKLIKLTAKGQ